MEIVNKNKFEICPSNYKLLLVEDQQPVRQGIHQMIETVFPNQFEILEANDGTVGLAILLENPPDIILTDIMMAEMSGLEMLENIPGSYKKVPMILMSAYEEFGYARRALQIGVLDYLMKPITENVLFVSLKKALGELKQKVENTYSDLVLYDYFSGTNISIEPSTLPKYSVLDQMNLPQWQLILVETQKNDELSELFELQLSLEFFFQKAGFSIVTFHNYRSRIAIAVNFDDSIAPDILKLTNEFVTGRNGLFVGLSGCSDGTRHIKTLFRQAEFALDQAVYQSIPVEAFTEEGQRYSSIITKNICMQITDALRNKKYDTGAEIADKVFSNISSLCPSKEMAQLEFEKLVFYIEMNCGVSTEDLSMLSDVRAEMNSAKTLLALKAAVTHYIKSVAKQLSVKAAESHPLQLVLDYIEKNYSQNINAAVLANIFNMSYSYFCSFFSKTMGATTSEYINAVRLRHAKNALETTAQSISEIARQCGFSDYRYFSKLFKKEFGDTPAHHRR